MKVLIPIKDKESVDLKLRIPVELHERIAKVKEQAKALGFTLEIPATAVAAISRLVVKAEAELSKLAKSQSSKAALPAPPALPKPKASKEKAA